MRQFIDVMSKRQDKDVLQLIQNYYGTVPVDCIGHIIDRQKLVQQAQLGLQYIQQLPSIAHVDAYFINTNTDTNTSMPPILNRGQETTLELGHPNHSLFSRLDPRTAQPNTDFWSCCMVVIMIRPIGRDGIHPYKHLSNFITNM